MAIKQLSAWIMVGVFALATIGFEVGAILDNSAREMRADATSEIVLLNMKQRKDERPSPWETRPMIPAGPKY